MDKIKGLGVIMHGKNILKEKLRGAYYRYWKKGLWLKFKSREIKNDDVSNPHFSDRVKASKPSTEEWNDLVVQKGDGDPIDVIVPVYEGLAETLRTIYSVLRSKTAINYNLIVINDCSPNAELTQELRKISKQWSFEYIENEINLGFVKTTNLGMSLHCDRDVIWLNSDTEVFDYWLDRLVEIANKKKEIATVTPLSNNATICSYPFIGRDNFSQLDTPDAKIDEICGIVNKDRYVETPTGVGFCMYVRRDAINKVGLLDSDKFGRGYGEENDFCQRFIKNGYINVITSSVFVRHYGAVSFKKEFLEKSESAMQIIRELHPDYLPSVARWVQEDPLRLDRLRIDCARLLDKTPQAKKRVLHITHSLGGGTETFVDRLKGRLRDIGWASYVLRAEERKFVYVDECPEQYPNLRKIDINYDVDKFKCLLQGLKIDYVHVHHLIDFSDEFSDLIVAVCQELGLKITFTVHDYFSFCPKIKVFKDGKVCCNFDISRCGHCCRLSQDRSPWRQRLEYARLFQASSKVTVPSFDTKRRMESVFPSVNFDVIYHDDGKTERCDLKSARDKTADEKLTIAIIGIVSREKGFGTVERMAKQAIDQALPVQFVLVGTTYDNEALQKLGVKITGRYSGDDDAIKLLKKHKADMIFIPSECPETYCYTLSVGLLTGLPVFSFGVGALTERLQNAGLGDCILPLDSKNDDFLLEKIVKRFDDVKDKEYVYNGNVVNPEIYYES
ncbi:MAG: glycosyltransferase [Duodenibacillus sp.]|nr:glycosyltransferase [Oscillospiraceae bacterium]MCF0253512.1 glycosyltransferase [Duodenibacillus sp.]